MFYCYYKSCASLCSAFLETKNDTLRTTTLETLKGVVVFEGIMIVSVCLLPATEIAALFQKRH